MSKKYYNYNNDEPMQDEDLPIDESAEDFPIEELPVEEVEAPVEKKVTPKKVTNNSFRVKVTSVRAIVFEEPDVLSKKVSALAKGNLANVTFDGGDWYQVEIPRSAGNITGFLKTSKVMRI